MIAADTNVLLRYLLGDDESQAGKSRRIFMGGAPVLITDVVLAETLWTLSGRRYNASKPDLVTVVDKLLQDSNIRFEDEGVIWNALQSYRETDADFADALIVCKALKTAAAFDEPCTVFTFDARALQLPNTAEP
ncbi:MAG: type II toxin-antitoxin system VapC family toxin [Gammaproteobacteria bacterium]|nr:type II toxin-antitoxin system VapC family toxin [Gammaproteobacteria bacterium]MYG97645.1 type II toxin-antitoxin system VapC family toxin [Gammaproteobacteria bacterium]